MECCVRWPDRHNHLIRPQLRCFRMSAFYYIVEEAGSSVKENITVEKVNKWKTMENILKNAKKKLNCYKRCCRWESKAFYHVVKLSLLWQLIIHCTSECNLEQYQRICQNAQEAKLALGAFISWIQSGELAGFVMQLYNHAEEENSLIHDGDKAQNHDIKIIFQRAYASCNNSNSTLAITVLVLKLNNLHCLMKVDVCFSRVRARGWWFWTWAWSLSVWRLWTFSPLRMMKAESKI